MELDPTGPPTARRSWIYLRSPDSYQYRLPGRPCAELNRWGCLSDAWAQGTGGTAP